MVFHKVKYKLAFAMPARNRNDQKLTKYHYHLVKDLLNILGGGGGGCWGDVGGMGTFFRAHLLGILFACTSETDATFNPF